MDTKSCNNCKQQFRIDPDDFGFYETIKVPPPTWCPQCRLKRRMAWQGYRFLYKRTCDFTGEEIISAMSPDSPHNVYRQDIWWSDKWDPKSYGRDYDPSRPFFDQWRELQLAVPLPSLMTEYTTMVGSDYCNAASTLKNCYLCFGFDGSEECAYCRAGSELKNCFDVSSGNFSELCYESVNITKCYQTFFSQDCEDCHDIWYSRDLVGCANCIGCINLRNKNYHAFNKPVTKEEYEALLRDPEIQKKAEEFFLTQPRRQFHGYKNQDVSGDYIYNCKNVKDSYMIRNAENLRYAQLLKAGPAYNCMDYTTFAMRAEWVYESCWVGIQSSQVKFSVWAYKNHDIEYCFGCMSSGNLFGCVGIRSSEYCILNKQYSPEEYKTLVEKIKTQMVKDGEYGEKLPAKYCPWPVNETILQEWFPINAEEAKRRELWWREPDKRDWGPAHDDVMKCVECGRNYQYIQKEIDFHKRFNLKLPQRCPLCRDFARIRQLNPIAIYRRQCAKCQKDIETSYAPDRPEIVYCEQCYQQEVS